MSGQSNFSISVSSLLLICKMDEIDIIPKWAGIMPQSEIYPQPGQDS